MANKPNPYNTQFSGGNPYEVSAHQIKAQKLASHFKARNIKSDDLAKMHPNIVAHHMMVAGVTGATDETMGVVHRMLKLQEGIA